MLRGLKYTLNRSLHLNGPQIWLLLTRCICEDECLSKNWVVNSQGPVLRMSLLLRPVFTRNQWPLGFQGFYRFPLKLLKSFSHIFLFFSPLSPSLGYGKRISRHDFRTFGQEREGKRVSHDKNMPIFPSLYLLFSLKGSVFNPLSFLSLPLTSLTTDRIRSTDNGLCAFPFYWKGNHPFLLSSCPSLPIIVFFCHFFHYFFSCASFSPSSVLLLLLEKKFFFSSHKKFLLK